MMKSSMKIKSSSTSQNAAGCYGQVAESILTDCT
jgi:hypothetical protein